MIEALTFLVLPLSFLSIGNLLVRKLKGDVLLPPTEFHLTGFSLGIVFFSYYWFVAGLFGLIGKPALYFYLGAALLLALWGWRNVAEASVLKFKALKACFQTDLLGKLLTLELLAIFILTFLRCWSSYIEGDSLVYHLYLPKMFVLKGALWKVPFSEHAFWPLLAQLCFIPGEILHSLLLSKWVTYLVFSSLSLLVGIFVYKKTKDIPASLLASVLIAGSPTFFIHAPSTYNDIYYSFFLIGSLVLIEGHDFSERHPSPILFLAGLLCGAALAVKYIALYGFLALLPVLFLKKGHWKGIVFFAVGVFLASFAYYLRSYLEYGNPVFPFAQGIFGTRFGYGLSRVGLVGSNLSDFDYGTGKGIIDFLLLPLFLTVNPPPFGNEKLGFLILPSFFLIPFAWRQNLNFLIFSFLYLLVWFPLMQGARYLLPVWGAVAIMAGTGYFALASRWKKGGQTVLFLAVFTTFFHTAWAGYHTYKDLFLRKEDPALAIARWLNSKVPPDAGPVMVIGDERLYYYDFVTFREKTFRNFTSYPDFPDPKETVQLLDESGMRFFVGTQTPAPFDPLAYFEKLVQAGFYSLLDVKSATDGRQYKVFSRTTAVAA